ncbi:hypothetical protein LTR62_006347 [Meristemomyces frigidus]|uniref:Uncharacterized protein n=1 Tax=Meristemomyces frigidus TaxID=1508187 RepID=A0AAN7YIK5_9PEZI|nr:hypothetical protein LTR62_006347 [Meristemomyces frigidus]
MSEFPVRPQRIQHNTAGTVSTRIRTTSGETPLPLVTIDEPKGIIEHSDSPKHGMPSGDNRDVYQPTEAVSEPQNAKDQIAGTGDLPQVVLETQVAKHLGPSTTEMQDTQSGLDDSEDRHQLDNSLSGLAAAPLFSTRYTPYAHPIRDDAPTDRVFTYGKAIKQHLDMVGTRRASLIHVLVPTSSTARVESMTDQAPDDVTETVTAPVTGLPDSGESNAVAPRADSLGDGVPIVPLVDTNPAALAQPHPLTKKKRKKRKIRRQVTPKLSEGRTAGSDHDGDHQEQLQAQPMHNSQTKVNTFPHLMSVRSALKAEEVDDEAIARGTDEQTDEIVLTDEKALSEYNKPELYAVVHGTAPSIIGTATIDPSPDEDLAGEQILRPHSHNDLTLQQTFIRSTNLPTHGQEDDAHVRRVEPTSTSQPASSARPAADASHFSSDGYEELLFTHRSSRNELKTKHAFEMQDLHAQIQLAREAKDAVQAKLELAQQQKASLAALLNEQKAKVSACKAKVLVFDKYNRGLGMDLDRLRKDFNVLRRINEELSVEDEVRTTEHTDLRQQLQDAMQQNRHAREKEREVRLEHEIRLAAATERLEYLEKQLSEKHGLLAEQRDKNAQLESRLIKATSANAEEAKLLRSNHDAISQQVHEIHTMLENSEKATDLTDFVSGVTAFMQGLDTQQVTTTEHINSVKYIIETLVKDLTKLTSSEQKRRDSQPSLETHLASTVREALKGVKVSLEEREQMLQQDFAHRESLIDLQNKYQTSNDRCKDLEAQLTSAQTSERRLQEMNALLKAKVDASQSVLQAQSPSIAHAHNIQIELDAKSNALEAMRLEVRNKEEELQALRCELATVQTELQSLAAQLEDADRRLQATVSQSQQLQSKVEAEVEIERQAMKRHCDKILDEKMADYKNRVRGLTSDNDMLQRKLQPLELDLAAKTAEVHELRTSAAILNTKHEEALQSVAQKVTACQQEAESKANTVYLATIAKLEETSRKLEAAEISRQTMIEEKTTLENQLHDLQSALQQAKAAQVDTENEVPEQGERHNAALASANEELSRASETVKGHDAGLKQLISECEQAVENEKQEGRRSIEALQTSLREAQDEMQQERQNGEVFRAEIEETWKKAQADFDSRLQNAAHKVNEVEVQRDQALADHDRLRDQVNHLTVQQQGRQALGTSDTSNMHQFSEGPSSHTFGQTSMDDPTSHATIGITPTMGNKENVPPPLRKTVDGQFLAVDETGVITAAGVLRPASRRKSAEGILVRGPVVEESQFHDIPQMSVMSRGYSVSRGGHHPCNVSQISDDMLDTASLDHTQFSTQVIEDTQFQDDLPSFANFNSGTIMMPPQRKSSGFTVPSIASLNSSNMTQPSYRQDEESFRPSISPSTGSQLFRVYEETGSHLPLSSQAQVQNTPNLPNAGKDKCSFSKSYPAPNTASKRSNSATSHSRTPSRSMELDIGASTSRAGGGGNASLHSSTPEFMTEASGHGQSQHTPVAYGSVSKRRISRKNSQNTTDPRLAQRSTAHAASGSKRKAVATSLIAEGYEHERKKHKDAAAAPATQPRRTSLRNTTTAGRPSIHDLPPVKHVNHGLPTSHLGSTSSAQTGSRMRTLGGSSSGAGKVSKKTARGDDFDARFSQELGRR